MPKLLHFGDSAGTGRLSKVNWDDLRVPAASARGGGSADPAFTAWIDTTRIWWFVHNAEKELFFNAQLPHGYKLGTNLNVHVHWVPSVNGNAGEKVCWAIEYVIQDIGETFAASSSVVFGNQHFPADGTLVANKHYLTDLGDIDGSGLGTVSAMLAGRIFRDHDGTYATDDYDEQAGLLEIDFHIQFDSVGSWEETSKGF